MGAAHEEPRRAPAGSLSARDFGGRFSGGSHGLARQGRAKPLAGSDRPAQGRVGRRVSAVAKARFVGTPLRLRVGGRRLSQARMEPQAECMLVLIGATPEGKKELIGFRTG